MTILGLILARGGSKRVPRKNIRLLGGRPLIAWTITAALQSRLLTAVVVSSDDHEILNVASDYGAYPLTRPAYLATDEISSYPAILHALEACPCDMVCLLQPTSPFRNVEDIDQTITLAQSQLEWGLTPAAVSRTWASSTPNGAVYVADVKWLKNELEQRWTKYPFDLPYLASCAMPGGRSIDIDTPADFELAEHTAMVMGYRK